MKKINYKSRYDFTRNTTEIIILYDKARIFSVEIYGQLQPPAIAQYAAEAIELLKEKGVIKS